MCECGVMGSLFPSLRRWHMSFRVTEPGYFVREAVRMSTGASSLAKHSIVKVLELIVTPKARQGVS